MTTNSPQATVQIQDEPHSGAIGLGAGTTVVTTPAFSPLYQQIKTLILQSLQGGEWKPGDVIPSEQDLALRFKVSQGTVRKAIDELAADNLVVRRQGKGTFVATHAERHTQYRFLRLQPDFSGEQRVERTIIDCKRLRASPTPAIPTTRVEMTIGTTIILIRWIKISPAGVSKLLINQSRLSAW
jgi:GntR family transcriptional regulator